MNTRVLLLLIATGLFASMWNSDNTRHPSLQRSLVSEAAPTGPISNLAECRSRLQVDERFVVFEGKTSDSALDRQFAGEEDDTGRSVAADDYQDFGCVGGAYLCNVDPIPQLVESNSEPPVVAEKPATLESDIHADGPLAVLPVTQTRSIVPVEKIAKRDGWSYDGSEMPLPENMAPGEYRIVSSQGEIRSMNFTAEDLSFHAAENISNAPAAYVVSDSSRQWYFIRVQLVEKTQSRFEPTCRESEAVAEPSPVVVSARREPRPPSSENVSTTVNPVSDRWEFEPIAAEVAPESNETPEMSINRVEESLQTFVSNSDGFVTSLLQNVGSIRTTGSAWVDRATETLGRSIRLLSGPSQISTEDSSETSDE